MSPAKKGRGGRKSALEMLTRSHARLEGVLAELRGALETGDEEVVEESLSFLQGPYRRHVADEEETVFPLLRETSTRAVCALIDRLETEHREHARLIDRLRGAWRIGDVAGALGVLAGLSVELRRHSSEEEVRLWPQVRKLSAGQLAAIQREMHSRRPRRVRRP